MNDNYSNNNGNHNPHSVTIVVNGRNMDVSKKDLTFEKLIELAFGKIENLDNTAYTVTYSYKNGHEHDNGILVRGNSIKNVKKGMIFNVTKTSRS